jgi:TRAP-type mannitol/chloroaromatic compound transport system substrate-binding protein
MPSDHLAIRKDAWDALPEDIQRIIEVAMQKLAFRTSLDFMVANEEAAVELAAEGVTLYAWSDEDRKAFRATAQENWQRWAEKTPEARKLVDSHIEFMKLLHLIDE